MARNNYGKRTRKISNKTSISLHPALVNLKERLSSPRLKAASTISTYLETSAKFLSSLGEDREPTDSDFRRYFIRHRREGISERTLRKEFFHLKKLAIANDCPWPLGAEGTSDMTPPRKNRTKALATANKAVNRLHPALENLVERLSSPRLRAPSTLSSYLVTGANFLSGLNGNQVPTDSDFRRYFIRRRQEEGLNTIGTLEAEEKEVLQHYCSLATEALLRLGVKRKAPVDEVVLNAYKNGIALGLRLEVTQGEVQGR